MKIEKKEEDKIKGAKTGLGGKAGREKATKYFAGESGKRGLNSAAGSRGPGAFTLVEIMVVVAVIGILAGIVLAAAGGVQKKAARDQTKAEIKTMSVALERYRNTFGTYPPGTNSTTALLTSLTNFMSFRSNQVSGTRVLDPYGRAYFYSSPGTNGGQSLLGDGERFEIWSAGPDGISAHTNATTRDDLTSWQ